MGGPLLELTAEISVVYITSCDSQFRIGLTLAYNRVKRMDLLFISDEMHRFVHGLANLLTNTLVGRTTLTVQKTLFRCSCRTK